MVMTGSYGLGPFFRSALLVVSLIGTATSSRDPDTADVAAMHQAPVIGTLPVPLMERRALTTNIESGSAAGRHQPHDQRQHSTNQDTSSSGTRLTPISSSISLLDESPSTSSFVRHPLCQQIEISESYLSGSESTLNTHPLGNVIDGDLGTRWATQGFASWLMVDLPEPTLLAGVAIDFGHKSTEPSNSQSFTMLVLGDYQVIHHPEVNAGRMEGLEFLEFEQEIPAKSVVLVGYGRGGYTSLAEIQLCGAHEATPYREGVDHHHQRSINRQANNKHLRGGGRRA